MEFEEEKGLTSLYVAASWGYPDLVDFLLMQQANPQLVDVRGNTALRVAIALQENKPLTCALVDRGQAQRLGGLRYREVVELLEAKKLETAPRATPICG
ncbi:unnamed protein product [Effrenium voratum]|nr:unnamed protein product [Effrenium voratum]